MGNPFAKPSVVVTTTTPKTTTKPTTTPTTPTTPTTIATTPEPTTLMTTTTAATPARITSEGLITHSSITQLDSKLNACCTTPTTFMMSSVLSRPPLHATHSAPTASSQSPFMLPLAIVMSTSFLIIALVLLVLVFRRRHYSDKHVENTRNPVLTPAEVIPSASFNVESSVECSSLNHIYVEHGERDSKFHDGLYTYVTKPSIIGGLPKGYAPSIKSPKRVFRGHPDGKSRTVQAKGFAQDAFGDEDHYNLLFEDRPSVVNVIVMNTYENHQPNDYHCNYANVTEIPESTTGFLEPPCATSEDTVSIKSSLSSTKNRDSAHETASAASQHDLRLSDCPPNESDNPTTDYEPNGSTRMLMSNDPEVIMGVQDDVLYENAPRSRGGSVKSVREGEPKYYVLERQLKEGTDTNDDNGMVENMLYQSITE